MQASSSTSPPIPQLRYREFIDDVPPTPATPLRGGGGDGDGGGTSSFRHHHHKNQQRHYCSSACHRHHHHHQNPKSTNNNTTTNNKKKIIMMMPEQHYYTSTAGEDDHYFEDDDGDEVGGGAAAATTTANSRSQRQRQRQRRWAVTLFSITTVLLFADQNLMSPNLTAIADEFELDDEERDRKLGGDISLAFFVLGAPASFLVGFLADTHDRSIVFAVTVAVGEMACLATYFVTSYQQLYLCRAITGFSVGGALPVIYSILGDLFAAEDRHVVSAVVSAGLGAGISVGQAVAGFLGPTYGWRLPFLVVSLPALLCSVLVYCTVKDPERGAMEQAYFDNHLSHQEEQEQEMQQFHDVVVVEHGDPTTALSSSIMAAEDDDGRVALMKTSTMTAPAPPPDPEPSLSLDIAEGNNHDDDILPAPFEEEASTVTFEDGRRQNQNKGRDSRPTADGSIASINDQYFDDVWSEHFDSLCSRDWTRHCRSTFKLLSTPTVLLSLIQGAPGCVPWGIINVFLNDYLSEDRGFSVEMATTTLMIFSLGYSLGLVVGGMGGRVLYQMDVRYPALLAGIFAIAGCFPLWYLLNYIDSSTPYYVSALSAMTAGMGSAPTGPIIKATLTNVTLPTARGQAFALFNLFDDFGKGLGPFFVSLLIVNMGGRLPAFNVGVFGWIVCGVANLCIFFSVARDERIVQTTLAAQFHTVADTT